MGNVIPFFIPYCYCFESIHFGLFGVALQNLNLKLVILDEVLHIKMMRSEGLSRNKEQMQAIFCQGTYEECLFVFIHGAD